MIPISSAISGGLVWSKIPHKCGYELKCNGEVVGSLRKMSLWSSEVQAESLRGSWRFRRSGFFHTRTAVLDSISGSQIATVKANWGGGGTLVFSDGQTFRITCKGFWRPVWTVLAVSGQLVLSIRSREKTVELANEFHVSEDRLALLVILTWHLLQQAAEDATSAAAVAAATS